MLLNLFRTCIRISHCASLVQNPKLEDMGLSQVLYAQASDVKIEADEILRMREKVYRGLMRFTVRLSAFGSGSYGPASVTASRRRKTRR